MFKTCNFRDILAEGLSIVVIVLAPPVNYHHTYNSKPICLQASKM